MLESILNPVLSPILRLPPILATIIISFLVTVIITIIYKYATDQTFMKDMKQRQKDLQKKMKENKHDQEKVMKLQKEMMELSTKAMSQSFKPTLITFIPMMLIFFWLNNNLMYEPIMPGQEFNATLTFVEGTQGNASITVPDGIEVMGGTEKQITGGTAAFSLKGTEGDYLLVFDYNGEKYNKELTITKERRYAKVQELFSKKPMKSITLGNEKLVVMNLLGAEEGNWKQGRLGFLGTYIIFSLLFNFGLRKVLKVY
ncbi:TMCO1/EMC3 family protein [archaeon]|nr:TMCO1/EMC3 family protein [archaeon]